MNEREFLKRLLSLPSQELNRSGIANRATQSPSILKKTAYFQSGEYDSGHVSHIIAVYSSSKDCCREHELYVIPGEGPYKILFHNHIKKVRIIAPDVLDGNIDETVEDIDYRMALSGIDTWNVATINERTTDPIVHYLTASDIHEDDIRDFIRSKKSNFIAVSIPAEGYINSVVSDIHHYDITNTPDMKKGRVLLTKVFHNPKEMLAHLMEINARSYLTNKKDIELVKVGIDINTHFDLDSLVEIVRIHKKWDKNAKDALT